VIIRCLVLDVILAPALAQAGACIPGAIPSLTARPIRRLKQSSERAFLLKSLGHDVEASATGIYGEHL
jgi:hypothetical protein